MKKNNLSGSDALHQKAKDILKKEKMKSKDQLSGSEMLELIHNLQLHQVELELQNEELRHLWAKAEVVNDRYTGLYDFTSTGYFMLSRDGKIIELNLSGANMLGKERLRLKNSRFIYFVSEDTKPVFNQFLGKVFDSKTKQFCEVDLSANGNLPLCVHLSGIVTENGDQCLVSATDISHRKQVEEELIASYQITEDIINSIPVRVFWKDLNLVYLGCNMIFARDAGFADPKDIIGKDDYMMGWHDQAELYRDDDKTVINSKCSRLLIEEPQTTPEGKTITLLTSKIPMRNSKGEVIGVLGTYMDITERKQAEDLIAQTRLNYEAFFNTTDEFLFVMDEQGNIIHTNKTAIDRLGYSREELVGNSILMVHLPERSDEARRIFGEMLNGTTTTCPVPAVTKSGVQIPVATRFSHGFWDGKPVIFGVTTDISSVILSEEKFSKLFHINPSASATSNLDDQTYVEVNEAFSTLFGFDETEVIGKTALELGILTAETANYILKQSGANGSISNTEVSLKAKNGEIKHVLLSAENFYVQDKKYRYTVVNDITELKQAELEREVLLEIMQGSVVSQNLKEFLRLVHHSIAKVIFAENFFVILYNNNTGLFEEVYLADKFDPPSTPSQLGQSISAYVFNTGKPLLLTQELFDELNAQGKTKLVGTNSPSWLGVPLRTTSETIGVMVVQDYDQPNRYSQRSTEFLFSIAGQIALVVEHKQAENQIRKLNETLEHRVTERTKQLETTNKELAFHLKEIEQFTFVASHDLQEPLLTLTNFTKLLQEEYGGKMNIEGNEYIAFISNSAIRMKALVKGLLDYSLLGKEGILTMVDCNKLVGEVLSDLDGLIKANNPGITLQELPMVNGYETELKLLFRHLIINAIKFQKKERRPEIKISAESQEKEFLFSVEDNGIGIEEKDIEKIFIIFKRMHNRSDYEGTGIGLSHCKKIV